MRKGRKIERKVEDQVIDTMCVQDPIVVPFIPGNSLELILLDFFSELLKNCEKTVFLHLCHPVFEGYRGDLGRKNRKFFLSKYGMPGLTIMSRDGLEVA